MEEQNSITATVVFLENGKPAQMEATEPDEEQLLSVVNLIQADYYPDKDIRIKQVFYNNKMLVWNETLAHYFFDKGRISFEDFIANSNFETEEAA